jgi:hypothetical protein
MIHAKKIATCTDPIASYWTFQFIHYFTANPTWKEITENLLPRQLALDCPNIMAQVFHQKLGSLMDDIMKNIIFGKAITYIYTIKYQKHGLPHVHLIVFLDHVC